MKLLTILLLLSTFLAGCSSNFRQVASIEVEVNKVTKLISTDIPTYGIGNIGIYFIRNKNEQLKAEIYIILNKVKKNLLATSKLVGITKSMPTDDFLRIIEELKTDRDYEVLIKLKDEASKIQAEAKEYYSLELFRMRSDDNLQELAQKYQLKKSYAHKKFDIDMVIVSYQSQIKWNGLLKNAVSDSKKYHGKQLKILKIEKTQIERLFNKYLERNKLYSTQIKDAKEYKTQVQITINELQNRISKETIAEMVLTVAQCTVPKDLQQDLSNCDKAKRVLIELISKLEDNIRMCEAELKNAETNSSLTFPKDTEVPKEMIQEVEISILNATVVALNAKINELKRQVSKFESKLDTVETATAKAQAHNQAMKEKINALIEQTRNSIATEIFKRDVEVKNMITHALTSIEANKDKEEMFLQLINELDQVIANVTTEINNAKNKLSEFSQEIRELAKQINIEKNKKKQL